jgi:hypothetical protein
VLLNPLSNRLNIIVSLVSDVVLSLVMLVGLLRLHPRISHFGLGRVLWNQVRWWWFLSAINLLILIFVHKSLSWLFLATVAEVPPAVSPAIRFGHSFFSSLLFHDIGVHVFKSKW